MTECGTKGTLLEANVTMITVEQCEEYYKYNTTNDEQDGLDAKKRVAAALPNGFRYGMLCAQVRPSLRAVHSTLPACAGHPG